MMNRIIMPFIAIKVPLTKIKKKTFDLFNIMSISNEKKDDDK